MQRRGLVRVAMTEGGFHPSPNRHLGSHATDLLPQFCVPSDLERFPDIPGTGGPYIG
jgi:hypothetical protein